MSAGIFLVVDKPAGITSHDVVGAVRAVTGFKKVGHTGTLDPFATGVLPLAIGPATRLIQYLDESIKIYDATIALGSSTDTGDPTGEVLDTAPLPTASESDVRELLTQFLGVRMQRPPPYSAVKYQGKPLYYYARKGIEVEVPARPITISDLELVHYDRETLRVRITCGRGTYARVLAQEIAEGLGSTGHLRELCRERSGPFELADSVSMQQIGAMVAAEPGHSWEDTLLSKRKDRTERVKWRPRDEVRAALIELSRRPLEALSHLPLADVKAPVAEQIRRGGSVPGAPAGVAVGGRYLVVDGADIVAVAELAPEGPKGLRVF